MHVVAMTDPVTGWFEAALLRTKPTADEIQKLFNEHWIARHPRLKETGFDDGGEQEMETSSKQILQTFVATWVLKGNQVHRGIHGAT